MGVAFCPEERGIFASLDALVPRKPAAATDRARRRPVTRPDLRSASRNLKERLDSQGTKLSARRAANAGDRQNPAHRRAVPDAGRTDRGAAAPVDHPADRPHHRAPQDRRVYHPAGRTNFPLRRDRRRPLLHRRARQGHRRFREFGSVEPIWTSSIPISASDFYRGCTRDSSE